MMAAGAWGHVLGDTGKKEWVDAAETVSRDNKYYSQEVPVVSSKLNRKRSTLIGLHHSALDHLIPGKLKLWKV
ncbi:MAG: hypothetical protein JKY52_07790 [Flavobacteriales bacterium]|nr:hypothetical protein [Flavobacteriales bacterium]